jgi:2-haloalkanoic acid dehalogenase type II
MRANLVTFDVFGTLIDWRAGLRADLARLGVLLSDEAFERVLAAQDVAEGGDFRSYRAITAASLVKALGLDPTAADAIGRGLGRWPWFPGARDALAALLPLVPCVAMTNSDRVHGEQAQAQFGFPLSDWVCAEDVRVYKPRAEFWLAVAARRGLTPGPAWWHVSAYADYDLQTAGRLGLTTVFVARPHSRPGPATHAIAHLGELPALLAE